MNNDVGYKPYLQSNPSSNSGNASQTKVKGNLVLLVEDNQANAELATDLLEIAGFQVVQAMTAELALTLATKELYDIILMDIRLPGIDGLEATRRLKQSTRTANIPIVALTAQAMPEDQKAAMDAGCVGYISKPIDTRRFALSVITFLGQERQ